MLGLLDLPPPPKFQSHHEAASMLVMRHLLRFPPRTSPSRLPSNFRCVCARSQSRSALRLNATSRQFVRRLNLHEVKMPRHAEPHFEEEEFFWACPAQPAGAGAWPLARR